MRETYQSLSDRNDLEVIFVRAAGSDADIPYGLHFLGYDVCYPPGGDGFSAICDCMFYAAGTAVMKLELSSPTTLCG